jgi:hypothetical protein
MTSRLKIKDEIEFMARTVKGAQASCRADGWGDGGEGHGGYVGK